MEMRGNVDLVEVQTVRHPWHIWRDYPQRPPDHQSVYLKFGSDARFVIKFFFGGSLSEKMPMKNMFVF